MHPKEKVSVLFDDSMENSKLNSFSKLQLGVLTIHHLCHTWLGSLKEIFQQTYSLKANKHCVINKIHDVTVHHQLPMLSGECRDISLYGVLPPGLITKISLPKTGSFIRRLSWHKFPNWTQGGNPPWCYNLRRSWVRFCQCSRTYSSAKPVGLMLTRAYAEQTKIASYLTSIPLVNLNTNECTYFFALND